MIVHVKKWYVLCIICIQLLAVYLFIMKHTNDKLPEKSYVDQSIVNNHPSFVKQLLLQMFELEFLNQTNIYELSKTTISQAKKNVKDKVYKPIDITLGVKDKHSYKLGNHINGSETMNILIITRSRSGSTITGDMLSRYPGTFYYYEPLYFGIKDFGWDDWNDSGHKIWKLKQMFKCEPGIEFLEYAKSWPSLFYGNFRFKNACFQTSYIQRLFNRLHPSALKKAQECFGSEIFHSVCSLFPIRLIKTIRIPFEAAETMLLDPEIGHTLKIIFLFRDPRARLQSIKSLNWCDETKSKNMCNVTNLCQDSTSDAIAATSLKEKYPDRIHIVRYEDVCLNKPEIANELQEFLDLEKSKFLEKFASYQNHKSQEFLPKAEKNEMTAKDILEIQKLCYEPMKTLGYPLMTSEEWNDKDNHKRIGKPSSQS